ncbi:MAG: hypothetical protein RR216_05615, partial [Pseudoflavonifractor sp.]
MEFKEDKKETMTRLACCVVAALALYYAADQWGDKLPFVAQHSAWLAENKVEAIAIAAAVLYGISMVLLPADDKKSPPDACEGYER